MSTHESISVPIDGNGQPIKNPFMDAETPQQCMNMIVGAASMCWENVDQAGVFESTTAKEIAEQGLVALNYILLKRAMELAFNMRDKLPDISEALRNRDKDV